MAIIKGKESIVTPLQKSALSKKGLCDYVINIASGCIHGCTFCYVPSTPAIRVKQAELQKRGVKNPQLDWGKYLFIRENIPQQLIKILEKKRTWHSSPGGKGVVMLCSGTDPYQNAPTAKITRESIQILNQFGKRVRVLTRSPLWLNDIDILSNSNVTVGMSIPYSDDTLSRLIEPSAPPPSKRIEALKEGKKLGCRTYVALAPTPPQMSLDDFRFHLEHILNLDPEVIFWEPINARGTNGKRMLAAGLQFSDVIMDKRSWASSFIHQWQIIEQAADEFGCLDLLHIWVDPELKGFLPSSFLEYWINRPSVENWSNTPSNSENFPQARPRFNINEPKLLESRAIV